MKKTLFNYLLIGILAMMLIPVIAFANTGTEKKPIDSTKKIVATKKISDKKGSDKLQVQMEDYVKNHLDDGQQVHSSSYSNPATDSSGYIKVYYPNSGDAYHLGGSMFVDYDVFDTWSSYYTTPLSGIFNSKGNLIDDSFRYGDVAAVDSWTNYYGTRELNSSDYSCGSYSFMVFNAPCYSDGTTVDGWDTWDNVPGISVDFKIDHTYGSWSVKTRPTALAKGKKTRKCKYCGYVQTQKIAKLKPTIKLSKTKVTLKKGKSIKIKVSKLARGDRVKSWKSSKKKVATVSKKGKIKARKKGKATITVKLASGLKKKIKVRVK